MKICLVHGHRSSREVIYRGLRQGFGTEVVTYSCCEDVLASPLDYDVFVVYNNFGPRKMRGIKGTTRIREYRADAFIVGVTTTPHFRKRFLKAGANVALLRAGNEIAELIGIIRRRVNLNQGKVAAAARATR